jgi:hypothetical protein
MIHVEMSFAAFNKFGPYCLFFNEQYTWESSEVLVVGRLVCAEFNMAPHTANPKNTLNWLYSGRSGTRIYSIDEILGMSFGLYLGNAKSGARPSQEWISDGVRRGIIILYNTSMEANSEQSTSMHPLNSNLFASQ